MSFFTAQDLREIESAAPGPDGRALSARAEALIATLPKRAMSPQMTSGLARGADFVAVCLSGALSLAAFRDRLADSASLCVASTYALALLAVATFQTFSVYRVAAFHRPLRQNLRVVGAWTLVFVTGLGVLFFLRADEPFARLWLTTTFAVGVVALTGERAALTWLLRRLTRTGRLERRVVVVGGGAPGQSLLQALANSQNLDLHVLGFFDDREDSRSSDSLAGYPKLGNIDDLVEFARRTSLDLVIFSLPITAETRLLQMLRKLWVLPIDIRLAAHMNKLRFRPHSYSYIGEVPVFDVFDKPISDWDVVLKAVFDRLVGAVLLLLASPVMALVAIGVKATSKGPILFKQARHGFNNEHIEVYKFRSMYIDRLDTTAQKQVTRDDPRVTPFGRFIRKTSLDELPQLLNVVFKGNLSLVGPRPHAVTGKAAGKMYDEVVDGYFARHRVKPGITGWAQVNGWRGETDTPEKMQSRVEYDLNYIENWSILFDLRILFLTPVALIAAKNAY